MTNLDDESDVLQELLLHAQCDDYRGICLRSFTVRATPECVPAKFQTLGTHGQVDAFRCEDPAFGPRQTWCAKHMQEKHVRLNLCVTELAFGWCRKCILLDVSSELVHNPMTNHGQGTHRQDPHPPLWIHCTVLKVFVEQPAFVNAAVMI